MEASIMTRSLLVAALVVSSFSFLAPAALADEAGAASVSVVRSQFTDKVENHLPVGDSSALAQDKIATYWVEMNNPGDATEVTLVWKLDGQEITRQSLDIGRASHWRTWGTCPTRKAHAIDIEVLDKDGHSLKTDSVKI
jgi:Protein of unknown function (DUF2914)